MSYFGARFPEGVDPGEYQEIGSPQEISCPHFRLSILRALNSDSTTRGNCHGCGEVDALILVISLDNDERLFVRRNAACTPASDTIES